MYLHGAGYSATVHFPGAIKHAGIVREYKQQVPPGIHFFDTGGGKQLRTKFTKIRHSTLISSSGRST